MKGKDGMKGKGGMKKKKNVLDDLDELSSKVELFAALDCDGNESLNYALYMYVESIKEHIADISSRLRASTVLDDVVF